MLAMTVTRSPLPLVIALAAGACGAPSSSASASATLAAEHTRPLPNTCSGCQPTMANTCMRILGAAVDRPGVTVARLCDPWCCQLTNSELGDIDYVHTVPVASWSTCPRDNGTAAPGAERGRIDGSVVEGPQLLVPRATVVVSGAGRTIADTTSELGRFAIDDLAAGTYAVTVYYGDVVFKQQCIHVRPGQTTELDVDLGVKIRTDAFVILE